MAATSALKNVGVGLALVGTIAFVAYQATNATEEKAGSPLVNGGLKSLTVTERISPNTDTVVPVKCRVAQFNTMSDWAPTINVDLTSEPGKALVNVSDQVLGPKFDLEAGTLTPTVYMLINGRNYIAKPADGAIPRVLPAQVAIDIPVLETAYTGPSNSPINFDKIVLAHPQVDVVCSVTYEKVGLHVETPKAKAPVS